MEDDVEANSTGQHIATARQTLRTGQGVVRTYLFFLEVIARCRTKLRTVGGRGEKGSVRESDGRVNNVGRKRAPLHFNR